MMLDASFLQAVSTLHVVVAMSVAAHRFCLWVVPFAVAVAVLRMVTLSLYRMIDVRGACDLF